MNINELYTPAILLNLDYMEHNLKKYCDAAAAHGKQIWPMIKTHKSTELAKLQMEYGCTGFLCGTLDEAEAQLARAQRIPFPNDRVQLVAGLSGAFCIAMIFGGTLRAGLAAAVAGLAASSYLLLCERLNLPGGFRKITTASLITLVCLPLCHLLGTEASHAIIGTLMILTPGIAFTMGIRDFVQGDYLSGTIRMIDALLVAACIAIGTGFVLLCYSLLTGVNIV